MWCEITCLEMIKPVDILQSEYSATGKPPDPLLISDVVGYPIVSEEEAIPAAVLLNNNNQYFIIIMDVLRGT